MSTQVIFRGQDAIQKMGADLKAQNIKKLLLVGGSLAGSDKMKEVWDSIGIPYVFFRDFTPNPKYEEVKEAIRIFRREGCDAIISMGGGSAIDVAKCVKLFCGMPEVSFFLHSEPVENNIILAAIPTTAGTGSESTRFAVIYYKSEKQSITHNSILPTYVALDGQFLRGLSAYQKKATFLDALCQAIESKWSVHSTPVSQRLADKAITMLLFYGEDYFANRENSYDAILEASNLAGQAINITQTTAPHAMSYKITSLFGVAHGHAVGMCLPVVWEYMYLHLDECIDPRGYEHLNRIFLELAELFNAHNVTEAIEHYRIMFNKMGISVQCEVSPKDFELLAHSVNPSRLKNSPVYINIETFERLYRQALATT